MKCVYKIGRLYVISQELFACFKPFQLADLQYDEDTESFCDAQGAPAEKPATFHEDKNALFLDFVYGQPDLEQAVKISSERDLTIWRAAGDWIYSNNSGKGWLQITPDYRRATYYMEHSDAEDRTTIYRAPVLMAVQCSLLMQGYIIVHAACVEIEDKAVLFSAPSGVGKSTRANCWVEALGASFISGDRPIIDPMRGRALGAPWDGKECLYCNAEVSIAAFNCIKRAEQTKLTRMTAEEKKRFLATQTFIPMWDPMLVARAFAGIQQMIGYVPIWSLACDRTLQAARECYDILFPKEPANLVELLGQLKAMDTPEAGYKEAIDRFMDFKARKLGIPYYGTFELTPLCNLDCKMCYVHLQKQQMGGCSLMSTEQWKNLMKQAYDAGMKYARLTGGECLTYPGFEELYLYLQGLGVRTAVLTNGLLLNDEKIELFKKYPPKLIQVTLYGSNNDAYEKVTGVRCFDLVYHNIMAAKKANLPIILAITPNAFAYEDIPNILKIAEKTGIPYNVNAVINKPRENTGRDRFDLTDEQYVEISRLRMQLNSQHIQPPDPAEVQEPSTTGNADFGIKCGAGRSTYAISWDGRMIPCLSLYDEYQSGKVVNFREAWAEVNHWAETLPVPSECGNCIYRPQCIQCIASHYNPEQPGHCNKDICRRTKKYVEAGLYRI